MKITLCGSSRFKKEWIDVYFALTKAGHVIYTMAVFGHADGVEHSEEEKTKLDLVHLAKIEESDAIFVVNVDGYVGESTRREVQWAALRDKEIYWLEGPDNDDLGLLTGLGAQWENITFSRLKNREIP